MSEGVISPEMPDDLALAVQRYEQAILDDDVAVLGELFLDDPSTLRVDPAGILIGHRAISEFRGRRGGVADRRLGHIEYRGLGRDTALVVARSDYIEGGHGAQTQVWVRAADRWRIVAAHVTPRPAAFDRSIWRVVGDPLLPGAISGPLSGLTFAVKDVFAVVGHRIGAGNPAFLSEAAGARESADAVQQLLTAGASATGIARTDEFAFSIDGANEHYGTPPNAAAPSGIPGGSSSGPASAVAHGFVDIGLATDTAGSVRVPASYQGLWGLRTSLGAVSGRGLLALAESFDTVGWLTRDSAVLELLADQFTPPPPDRPLATDLCVPVDLLEDCDPAVAAAFESLLELAATTRRSLRIRRVRVPEIEAYRDTFRIVQAAEAWRNHGAWIARHRGDVGPAVAARFLAGSEVSPRQEAAARQRLGALRSRLDEILSTGVLVVPTTPASAPRRGMARAEAEGVRARTLRSTTLAAVGGVPAVSAPLLHVLSDQRPAPVGVSFIGRYGHDRPLVRLARDFAHMTSEELS